MKQFIILTVFHLLFINIGITQKVPYNIEWSKCYGGTGYEYLFSTINTNDSGHISAGYTNSNDGDVKGLHGLSDAWVLKTAGNGTLDWQKCFGGTGIDEFKCVQKTKDGGFVFAGFSTSNDGDLTNNNGKSDVWVVKTDNYGNIEWQKNYGGSNDEQAQYIQQTNDDGFIIVGWTNSYDGDVTGNHRRLGVVSEDVWVIKIDNIGNIIWENCYGGSDDDVGASILQTKDRGYIILGGTNSNDGDVNGNHGNLDVWVVKINSLGNIQWQKCYGGSLGDDANSFQITMDDGYIIAGGTSSNDGDVNGFHGGNGDAWVFKIDSIGNIQWQKCFGGSKSDYANSIIQTVDGGYFFGGSTFSYNGDVNSNHIGNAWVVKLDNKANIQWQNVYGGSYEGQLYSVAQINKDEYLFAGDTFSNDGDVHENHSKNKSDAWIVKLSSDIIKYPEPIKILGYNNLLNIFPNPSYGSVQIQINNLKEFRILDVLGRVYLKKSIDSNNLSAYTNFNIQNLAKGMYEIQAICIDGSIKVGKFIIQ